MNNKVIRIMLESYGTMTCRYVDKPSAPWFSWTASMAVADDIHCDLVGYGAHSVESKRDLLNELQIAMADMVEMIEDERS